MEMPDAFVAVTVFSPVASLVSFISALGATAPLGSTTVPVTVPLNWAQAFRIDSINAINAMADRTLNGLVDRPKTTELCQCG